MLFSSKNNENDQLLFSTVIAELNLFTAEEYIEKGGIENIKKALSITLEYCERLLQQNLNEKLSNNNNFIFIFIFIFIFLFLFYFYFIFNIIYFFF